MNRLQFCLARVVHPDGLTYSRPFFMPKISKSTASITAPDSQKSSCPPVFQPKTSKKHRPQMRAGSRSTEDLSEKPLRNLNSTTSSIRTADRMKTSRRSTSITSTTAIDKIRQGLEDIPKDFDILAAKETWSTTTYVKIVQVEGDRQNR